MSDIDAILRGRELIAELATVLRALSDHDAGEVLSDEALSDLLNAIFDPSTGVEYPNIAEFLLANRHRWGVVGVMFDAMRHGYKFEGKSESGEIGYVSPAPRQWFDDGVMFLEGPKPGEGLLGLYHANGQMSYAILARDVKAGEPVGPDDFSFLPLEETKTRLAEIPSNQEKSLDVPVQKLKMLLDAQDNDESKYQELLRDYHWVFGTDYTAIERHTNLDERNIPDFTGVRVVGGYRDIFELKPPFTSLFRKDGVTFSDAFHRAWDQAERYLNFVTKHREYVASKGLLFDDPICYLFIGYNLSDKQREFIMDKQRLNPYIKVRTYNDLHTYMVSTIDWVRKLSNND